MNDLTWFWYDETYHNYVNDIEDEDDETYGNYNEDED